MSIDDCGHELCFLRNNHSDKCEDMWKDSFHSNQDVGNQSRYYCEDGGSRRYLWSLKGLEDDNSEEISTDERSSDEHFVDEMSDFSDGDIPDCIKDDMSDSIDDDMPDLVSCSPLWSLDSISADE